MKDICKLEESLYFNSQSSNRNSDSMPVKIEDLVVINSKMEVCEVSGQEAEPSSSEENIALDSLSAADKAKIEAILSSSVSAEEMKITLLKLPEAVTLVFLQSIQSMLAKKVNCPLTCLGWLRVLLQVHEDMDDPKCKSALQEILASLESAMTLQNPLNNLKGKLDLLLYQADAALKDGQLQEPQETFDFSEMSDEDTNNVIQTNGDTKVLGWDDFSEEEIEKSDEEMDHENASENSDAEQQDGSEHSDNDSDSSG